MANSPARAPVDVGSVIADTYKIEALLGRGGMGAVFLASHRRLAGKQVAIKILHTELEDAEIVARFRREAEIAAKLNHPNIVGVIDYNLTPEGMPYLVLDYLEGETLAQRVARGPMALDHVLSIVRQVGSALAAAHRAGIVHRDLKPQNIFIVPTEVDGRVVEIAKVLDFGISKIRGSQTVKTQDSALLGTPQYMAPEQATGQHANVDERTDVFALGAIVYEMLCGQPAFQGASIPEVVFKVVYEQPAPLAPQVPSVPLSIVSAVSQAMAKPSHERFPTVTSFIEAMTGQPLTLPRGPLPAGTLPSDAPSGRRVNTAEAFDRTMGSGDHGASPVNPLLATAAPTASVTAPPIAPPPQTLPPPNVTASRAAPTVDLSGGPHAPRRSGALIAVIAIAAAVIAGAVVTLVTRGTPSERVATADPNASTTAGSTPGSSAPVEVRAPTDGSGANGSKPTPAGGSAPSNPTPTDPTPTDPTPAATPTDPKPAATPNDTTATADPIDAKGSNAKIAKPPKPPRPQPPTEPRPPRIPPVAPPTIDEGGDDGDDDIRQKLRQASAALDRRDYDLAERLATSVINSHAAPRQHATARLIHGTVQCVARNDQEAAGIDVRSLEGFRAMRTKLLAICKSRGILIGD
jgi:eukaryotic-like serine/threonine-protein kinase